MDRDERARLEAALFQSSGPVSLEELSEITGVPEGELEGELEEFRAELESGDRGVELFENNQHYELRVKKEHADHVSHLTPYADLSRGLLKVLALTVYKQPVTQAEIVKTIGNRAYSYIQELEDRGLINTEKYKRTKKIELTEHFMSYFGISSRKELLRKFREQKGEEEDEEPGLMAEWLAEIELPLQEIQS